MQKPQIHYPKGRKPSKQAAEMMEESILSPEVKIQDKVKEPAPENTESKCSPLDEDKLVFQTFSGQELLKYYSSNSKIKMTSKICPSKKTLTIRDASLRNRDGEDADYLNDCELLVRLRRGNAIVVDSSDQESKSARSTRSRDLLGGLL